MLHSRECRSWSSLATKRRRWVEPRDFGESDDNVEKENKKWATNARVPKNSSMGDRDFRGGASEFRNAGPAMMLGPQAPVMAPAAVGRSPLSLQRQGVSSLGKKARLSTGDGPAQPSGRPQYLTTKATPGTTCPCRRHESASAQSPETEK